MKTPKLDYRLKTIAGLIKKGSVVADVGTDHGYLAVYLDKSAISKKIYAVDIAKKPLNQAKKTISLYNSKNVETILSDGLDEINNEKLDVKIDTVVLAGMGGNLIGDIICRANWLKDRNINLICQPMSGIEKLREKLYFEGFFIKKEILVYENEKIYTIMLFKYSSNKVNLQVLDMYTGEIFNSNNEKKYIKLYFDSIIYKLNSEIEGMRKAEIKTKNIEEKLKKNQNIIQELEKLLKKELVYE